MRNVEADPPLKDLLQSRTGIDDIERLRSEQFATFFKLGIPKVASRNSLEEDWYVDPESGIKTYEFQRPSSSGTYTMLHFVMDVIRQNPHRDKRAPNTGHEPGATAAYKTVTRHLFQVPETHVNDATVTGIELKPTLEQIKSRRKKYYPED